jgi:hypothetical protein
VCAEQVGNQIVVFDQYFFIGGAQEVTLFWNGYIKVILKIRILSPGVESGSRIHFESWRQT